VSAVDDIVDQQHLASVDAGGNVADQPDLTRALPSAAVAAQPDELDPRRYANCPQMA
jgi:hypothetical protein